MSQRDILDIVGNHVIQPDVLVGCEAMAIGAYPAAPDGILFRSGIADDTEEDTAHGTTHGTVEIDGTETPRDSMPSFSRHI